MTIRPRILIVEDEPLIRLHVATSLQDVGYEVLEAADADEALQLLGTNPVDLLLTDITLPGQLDGLQLVGRTHQFNPDIPVILTSGRFSAGAIPDAYRHLPFFPKPVVMPDLTAFIANLLQTARPHPAAPSGNSANPGK